MQPFIELADLYAKNALEGLPYSALPNAPVLPYVERRPSRVVRAARAARHISGRFIVLAARLGGRRDGGRISRDVVAAASRDRVALSCSAPNGAELRRWHE